MSDPTPKERATELVFGRAHSHHPEYIRCETRELIDALARELAAAREQGRIAGLEEAAEIADERRRLFARYDPMSAGACAGVADSIRASAKGDGNG